MNGTDPTLELLWKKIGADTIASLDEFTKDMQDSQDLRRSVWKKIGADKIDSFEQFEKDFGFVTDAEPQPVEPKKQAYEFDWKAAAKKDLSQSHLQFSPKGSIQEYGVNSQGRLIDKQARPKTEKSLSDIAALNPNTPFGQQFGKEENPLQQYKTINEVQKLTKDFNTKQKEIERFKQSIGDNPSEADIVELNKQNLELLSVYEDNKDFLKEAVNTLNEQSDLKKEKALSLIPAKEFYNNNFAKTFDGPLASLSGDFAEWMTDSKQQELFKGWSTDPNFNDKKRGFVIQQFINSKQNWLNEAIESARTEDEREAYQAYQKLLNSSYAKFLEDTPKEKERLIKQIEKQRELQVQDDDSAITKGYKVTTAGLKSAYNTGVNALVDLFVKLPKQGTDALVGLFGVDTNPTDRYDRLIDWTNNLVDKVTFDLPELKDEDGLDAAGSAAVISNVVVSLMGLRAVAGVLSKAFSARKLAMLKGLNEVQRASILARAEKFQKGEQFLAGLMTYAPRTIESYKEQGLSNSDAVTVGLISSGISSVIEMISPGIPFGTSLTKDAYLKLAKEGATRGTILKEVGKGLVANNVNEIGEELLDDWVNQVILPTVYNDISGQNLKETSLSEYINEDALNTMFITAVATGIFGGALTVGSGQLQEIDGFVDAVKNIDTRVVTEKIQDWVQSGQITTEQGVDFLQFIQKQKAVSLEIESKKESIANLEKTRDSEAFKYKEVTETDILGNRKKVKRLKTPQELKESTDKINLAIGNAKAELKALEQQQNEGKGTKELPSEPIQPKGDGKGKDKEGVGEAVQQGSKGTDNAIAGTTTSVPLELSSVEETAKALGGVELRPNKISEFNDDWVSERISKEDSFFGSRAKMNVLRATRDDIIASLNPKQQAEIVAIYDAEMQRLKGNPYAKDVAIERVFDKLSEYAPSLKKRFEKQTKGAEPFKEYLNDAIIKIKELKERSEAYHKAKADGTNTKLVKAVEFLLSKEQQKGNLVTNNKAESETISDETKKQISELEDDKEYTAYVNDMNEIPQQFRDRATKLSGEIKSRKSFLGIPYGKENTIQRFRYTFTGREAKDELIKQVNRRGDAPTGIVNTVEGGSTPPSPTTSNQSKIETKKADIERRREEEENDPLRVNLAISLVNAKNDAKDNPESLLKGLTDSEIEDIFKEELANINLLITKLKEKGKSNEEIAKVISSRLANSKVLKFKRGFNNSIAKDLENFPEGGYKTSKEINAKYDAEQKAVEQSLKETTKAGSVGVGGDVKAKNKAFEELVNLIPTTDLRRPNGSIGTQGFSPENLVEVARHIAKEMGFDIPAYDKNKGTSEIKQVIDYLKNNKEAQQKIRDYVVKDPVVVSLLPDNTYEIEDGNHRANLLNLIGVDVIPTIELNGRDKQTAINEHNSKVEAVEQSLKETTKAGSVGVGGDVKVQDSEYKGVTGKTSVNVKEKDGIIKATFKGTRSDKPNATIGGSGYRYGGKAVKETLSDFEKDYGVKLDEIIDGVDIAEITVLEERAEVNPRQGVGTGQSVTLRIRDTEGNIINDVNIVVNKRKFTEPSLKETTKAGSGGVGGDVESKKKSFTEAGEQSKKDQSPKALGNFIIDNTQVGDRIKINENEYYEVVSKKTNKKGHTETELQHFVKNEETGEFENNPTAVKLFTDKYRGTDQEKLGYRDASDLFESTYTNNKGERIIEQSTFEPKAEQQPTSSNQSEIPKVEEGSGGVGGDENAWGSDKGLTENFYTTDVDGYAIKKPITNPSSVTIDGVDFHIAKVDGDWKVIEKKSGLEISTGKISNTKNAAIEDATIRLAQNGGAKNLPTLIDRAIQGFKDRNTKAVEQSLKETTKASNPTVQPKAETPTQKSVPEKVQEEGVGVGGDAEAKNNNNIENEINDVRNAKTKEELIKASERLVGMNPYDDGAVSMGTRAALMTPNSFERGKELFLDEIKNTIEIKRQAESKAVEQSLKEQPKAEPQKKVEQVSVTQKNKQPTISKTGTTENPALKDAESAAKALEGVDTFHLVENEGEWKATTKTYRGREIGNWAISNLDKKQQKEYLKIRDEADTYGTKEQAEENLKKLKDFEQKNKEAFERAKQEIDALKEAEERKAEERKKQQKIFDQTEQELNKLSDKEFDKLVELIDEKRRQTLEQRFGDRVEKRTLFITPISEAYHKAKSDGSNPELVKAVESLLSKDQPTQASAVLGKEGEQATTASDVLKQESQVKTDGTDTKKQVEEKTAEKAEEKVIYTSTSATLPHRIIERNGERVVQQKSKGEWKDVKNKQISEAVLENFGLKPEPKKEDKEESFNDAFEKALKEQGGVVSDIDITKRNLDAKGTTNYNKIVPRTKVQKAVMGTIKKLASKLIGVKTYVHESIDSYANALSEAGYPAERAKSSNAFYDGKSIHVFLGSPGLKNNTFLHEGVHAVISAKLKENRAVLTKWVSQLYTDSALFRKYFTEYAGREYDSKSLDPALVDEEAVTEFLADKVFEKMLEDANTDRNLFDNLKEWFRNLLRRLGYKADVINPVLSTDEDVFSFADRLADLFKTSAVQTTDINKGTIRFQDEGDFSQAELNNKKERLRTTIRNKIPEINSGKIPHNAIIASAKKQGIPEEETLEILKQEIYGFTPDVTRLVHAETKAILKKIGTKTESEKTGLEDRVYQAIQRGLITDNSFEGIEAVLAQKELNGGRINGVEITALQYAQQQVQEAANEVDNKMTEARNSWTKSYGIENDLGYRALENEFRFLNFLKIDLLAHSIQVGSQKGADLQSLQQYLTDAQKYAKKLLSRMVDKITPKEKAEFGAKATEVEKASEQYAKALEKSQTDKDQKLKSGAEKEVSEQSKKSGKKTKYDDLTTDELDKRISKLLEGNDLLEGTVLFQDNDEKPNGGGDLNKNIELYKLLRARANKVIKELQKKGTFPTADEVYLKMKDLFPKLSKDAFYKAMVFGSEGAINEATKYAQRERANLTNFIKRKLKADLLAKAKMEKLLRGEKLTPEDEEQYSKAATDALNMALQIGLSTNELLQLSEDLNKLNLALDKSRAADMAAKEIKAALAKIDDEITKRAENRKKNYEKKLKDIQERLDKLANGDPDGLDGLVVPNQDKLVSFELTQARKRYQNEREKLFVFANYLEHKDRIDKANTVLGKMYQHYMAQGGKKALASSLFEVSRSMKAMFDLSSFFVQAIGWTVPSAIPGIRVLNTKGLNKDEIRTLQNKSLSKWSLHLGGNVFANWNIPITANAFRNAVDIIAKGLSIKKDSFKLAAIRHNEDIKSTVFYDLAERAGVDLSEVGDISQREDFFHSDFFKTMANLPTSTFSENKKAGGLLKAIWKQTGTTAVTAAKGIQLVKEISEEIYIYSLNEFKVNQFRQTVMAAGAINDLDYQKFIARQINIQFGTAKIASSDESALTFLDNNFWKYVFFAPHLFMNRIRQVFNYGTSPVRLAAGVITGNKKAQKEEAYKIIHTTKALASYGALMYLAELLGLEWDDDPRSSTFMKLKYGDKTLDMTGGFAPIWKMFGRTTYYAGQNEKTPGKAIRSVVGPIMKYMPFIGVEDYFTSDVPASLKGSLAMSNFRDEYVRFLTYKLHPSVSLGVVTGANYFATGDLTDAIGKPIYSEIVAQLGGDPSGWLSTTLGMASHMFMPIFLDQLSDDILKYTDKKPETFDDYVYSFWGNGMFAFMGANTTDYEDLMKAQEIQNYFDSSKVFNGRNPFKMLRFEDLKIYDGGATKKVPDWMLNNTIYKSMLKDYAKAYYAEDLQQRIKAGTSPKEMERLIFGQNGIRKKAMRKAVNEIERQYGKDNKPK